MILLKTPYHMIFFCLLFATIAYQRITFMFLDLVKTKEQNRESTKEYSR